MSPEAPFLYKSADALCAIAIMKIFTANMTATASISFFLFSVIKTPPQTFG